MLDDPRRDPRGLDRHRHRHDGSSRACRKPSRWRPSPFEDLGNGRTRLHAQSLTDSFEGRDAWLASGMEVGVNEGYAKLDELLADATV